MLRTQVCHCEGGTFALLVLVCGTNSQSLSHYPTLLLVKNCSQALLDGIRVKNEGVIRSLGMLVLMDWIGCLRGIQGHPLVTTPLHWVVLRQLGHLSLTIGQLWLSQTELYLKQIIWRSCNAWNILDICTVIAKENPAAIFPTVCRVFSFKYWFNILRVQSHPILWHQ